METFPGTWTYRKLSVHMRFFTHFVGLAGLVSVTVVLTAGIALHDSAEGDRQPRAEGIESSALAGGGTSLQLEPSRRPWSSVRNWVYWLDGPRLDVIGASAFQLAVIDYSADGTADGEFEASQIETLRHAGCERRVVAYVSIGEAEDYRFYWDPSWTLEAPSWLEEENGSWRGNYPVHYWEPAWQELVHRYVDRVVAQGFDGIYLDRVDAYAEPYAEGHEREMVDFVRDLAAYARSRSPLGEDFAVIIQNAEELGARYPELLASVDGIGREETYVQATNIPTATPDRVNVEKSLDLFREKSRRGLVLTVDYAARPELVTTAYDRSHARGYVPYVTDVRLNRLRVNPSYEPTCDG